MELTVIWIIGIIAFVILEAVTYQLVSIWFAFGAIGGLIAAALGTDFYIQMTIFLIISLICILCLRPFSVKILKPRNEQTNVDAMVGKDVLITDEVDNVKGLGSGKLDGKMWSVRSADDSIIPSNSTVVVEKIEGVKLIVKRKEN